MFVRVYDKISNKYYKSIVYGLIDVGYYEKAIVVNPYTNCFELVEYLDKTTKALVPLYQKINADCTEWVYCEKIHLLKLKKHFKDNDCKIEVSNYRGYEDVFNNFDFMLSILENKSVLISKANIKLRDNNDVEEWNYIRTQSDADEFMKQFVHFHDSILDKMNYEESETLSMETQTQLIMRFDNSGWYGVVELCFEGILALNLRPPLENYSRELSEASLIVRDECVFWADDFLEQEDLNYDGTYVKALNLKWRKVD